MIRPRVVTILLASGAKGGVGKSTIAASLAPLFDAKVLVLDLGIDGNTTVAAYHRVNTDDMTGLLDYLLLGQSYDIAESKISKNVFILPAGHITGLRASLLAIPNRYSIKTRFNKLLIELAREGFEIIIIDTPSNAELLTSIYVTLLYYSDILCLVTEPTLPAQETLYAWWNTFSKVITRDSQTVNIIVNKFIEKFHNNINALKKYVMGGSLIKIPFDAAVLALSSNAELPIMYQEASRFNKALSDLLKIIEEQCIRYIGVRQFSI